MHAYWFVCLLVDLCSCVSENVDPNVPFFCLQNFVHFTLNFYYNNVYNSEKRGNRISHYADVPNKSTRWPSFSWCFLVFMVWFSPAKSRRPIEAIGGVTVRLGRDVWVCVCACDEMSDFPSASRDQCCQKLFLQSTNYMSFFSFFLVILFCGVHISNLFAIILSFIFWG